MSELRRALPLAQKGHSLEADMLFGWRPSKNRNTSIELFYSSDFPETQESLIYKGYRATDSLSIHKHLSNSPGSSYDFNVENAINIRTRPQSPEFSNPDPIFNSKFDSGNLDRVYRVKEDEYDLYLRSDTNTYGHTHWFYFSVSAALGNVKFNIVNFSRKHNLYSQGMKIQVFKSNAWRESGHNIMFTDSKYKGEKKYYQLSFEYKFKTQDTVWFAASIPYSVGRLQEFIKSLLSNPSKYKSAHMDSSVLTRSLGFIDVPLLTITNPIIPPSNKKEVLIIGRVHPSETVGSWVTEGLIKFILKKKSAGTLLRNNFIFYIIPMINPDGVLAGNSRTGMSGDDLNRQYTSPDEYLHPEIYAIKKLASSKNLLMLLDIHGHSGKKGSFVYGPYYPLHDLNYFKSRIIPKLMSEKTPIFRYYSSRFRSEPRTTGIGRVVLEHEFGVKLSYTLENSYFGYFDQDRITHTFTLKDLFSIGKNLMRSLCDFHIMMSSFYKKKGRQFSKSLNESYRHERKIAETKDSYDRDSLEEFVEMVRSEQVSHQSSSEESDSEEECKIEISKISNVKNNKQSTFRTIEPRLNFQRARKPEDDHTLHIRHFSYSEKRNYTIDFRRKTTKKPKLNSMFGNTKYPPIYKHVTDFGVTTRLSSKTGRSLLETRITSSPIKELEMPRVHSPFMFSSGFIPGPPPMGNSYLPANIIKTINR